MATGRMSDGSLCGKELGSKWEREFKKKATYKTPIWDFPGCPVVGTPCFHCRGHEFNTLLGNEDPTNYVAWPKKKKKCALIAKMA